MRRYYYYEKEKTVSFMEVWKSAKNGTFTWRLFLDWFDQRSIYPVIGARSPTDQWSSVASE